MNRKKLLLLLVVTIFISLIIFPLSFNYLFLWYSGFVKGSKSDWFTLYGGIVSGLIGGLFTYLALWYTLKNENNKSSKKAYDELLRNNINVIVNNNHFIELIEAKLLAVSGIANNDYIFRLDDIASEITFRSESFSDKGIGKIVSSTAIDHVKYEQYLKSIEKITTDFLCFLRNNLPKIIKDKECYDTCLDFYLGINLMKNSISESLINDSFKDLDFFYGIVSYKMGFSVLIKQLKIKNNKLWDKYLKKDEYIGETARGIEFPHIKG